MTETFRLYRYRWAVLAVFMFVNLTIQILWISYAPITGPAAQYYGVTDLQIGLFAMTFMSAFVLGFFLVSTSPIGMQYAAEITFPTPEGTSNGLIQLFGQASVVFVFVLELLKSANGAFTPALLVAVGLLGLSLALISRLKDPVFQGAARQPAPIQEPQHSG